MIVGEVPVNQNQQNSAKEIDNHIATTKILISAAS